MGCGRSTARRHAIPVCRTADFADRTSRCVTTRSGQVIAVFRVGSSFYALDDACAHRGAPLSLGDIEDCGGAPCVACPWHACHIFLGTGTRAQPANSTRDRCASLLASRQRQRVYRVLLSGGIVYVDPRQPHAPPERHALQLGAHGAEDAAAAGAVAAAGGGAESDRWIGAPRCPAPASPNHSAVGSRALLVRRTDACSSGATCTFELSVERRPSDSPLFLPGQFGTFELPDDCRSGFGRRPAVRHWSLHACEGGATVAVSVKRRYGGSASTWLHRSFAEGSSIRLLSVGGDFGVFVRRPPTPKILMLAVGIGVTPLYSQLAAIFGDKPHADAAAFTGLDVVLLYGERERADLCFTNELDRWEADLMTQVPTPVSPQRRPQQQQGQRAAGAPTKRLSVHYALSDPDEGWGGIVGRLCIDSIRAACPDAAERAVQICAPVDFRETVVPQLVRDLHVRPGWITQEEFDL
eukprot:TRINITY_DN268_c3_g1_i1.p1 TRINITY_DN268_c3_g1~~TRINITY_DN268_c3_g1_i1.p1  ORF type:complete len:467 (+),score=100.27 TRINITY_DN268_c3_g1_i1:79-1479(+)